MIQTCHSTPDIYFYNKKMSDLYFLPLKKKNSWPPWLAWFLYEAFGFHFNLRDTFSKTNIAPKIVVSNKNLLCQGSSFRGYVSSQECICWKWHQFGVSGIFSHRSHHRSPRHETSPKTAKRPFSRPGLIDWEQHLFAKLWVDMGDLTCYPLPSTDPWKSTVYLPTWS